MQNNIHKTGKHPTNIIIIKVYALIEESTEEEKDNFYVQLEDWINRNISNKQRSEVRRHARQ